MSRKVVVPGLAVVVLAAWFLSHRGLQETTVSGTIEQDEARIGARVAGRLARLYADEGDALTNGQLVAVLDAPELQARWEAAEARLAELVAGPRTQEIAAAHSEWDALTAEVAHARLEAARAEGLSRSHTVSDSERDAARTRADALEKKVRAAQDRYELLAAGTRPEQVAQARAQTREAAALLAETRITAPAAGTLDILHAREGDVLTAHAPVATVVFQRRPYVRVYVPEPWLPHLEPGATLPACVDGRRDKTFAAEIIQIARKAEFTPRNVQTDADRVRQVFAVKVRLPDDAGLRPGMTVEVELRKKKE